MPGAVIHRFKAIKIDKHQGMSLMCTVYRLQQDTQLILKTGAGGGMRQWLMGAAEAEGARLGGGELGRLWHWSMTSVNVSELHQTYI